MHLSSGATQLAEIPRTLKDLAVETGISTSVLSRLRSGELRAPSDRVALALELKLGIARSAWHMSDEAAAEEPAAAPPVPPVPGDDASPRAHLALVRQWRTKLQRDKASPRDITAAFEAERRAVELVRKSTQEDAEEIVSEIQRVLQAFPEARAAVAEALSQ